MTDYEAHMDREASDMNEEHWKVESRSVPYRPPDYHPEADPSLQMEADTDDYYRFMGEATPSSEDK